MQDTERFAWGPACRDAAAFDVDLNQLDYLLR